MDGEKFVMDIIKPLIALNPRFDRVPAARPHTGSVITFHLPQGVRLAFNRADAAGNQFFDVVADGELNRPLPEAE